MDILVTTPKSKHKLAEQEAEFVKEHPDAYWFRTIRGKPDVQVGDRVYYVDMGEIRGYGIVFDIEYGELECETTGKLYVGTHLKQRKWIWFKHSVKFKGFQGFRYIDRIEGLREKLESAEDERLPSKEEIIWALKNPDTVKAMEINNKLRCHKDWNSSKVLHRCPLCGYETCATNVHRHCPEAPIDSNLPKTLPEYLQHMSVLMYVVDEKNGRTSIQS